jgi:hypothetical protein
MRRIENMKTMRIHQAVLGSTVLNTGSVRTARPELQQQPVTAPYAAIERQLDEIQHTFGVRWEW